MHYFQQSNKLLASQFSRNEWTRTVEQIEKQTPEIIDEYITLAKHQWGTNRKSDVEASTKIITIMLLTGNKKHSGLKASDLVGIARKKLRVLLNEPIKPKDEINDVIERTIREAKRDSEWPEILTLDFQLRTSMSLEQVLILHERLSAQKTFRSDTDEIDEKRIAEIIGNFKNMTKDGLDTIINNEFRLNKFVTDIRNGIEDQERQETDELRYKMTAKTDLLQEPFIDEYFKQEFKYPMLAIMNHSQEQDIPKKEALIMNIILGNSNTMIPEHEITNESNEILFDLAAIYMLTNLGANPHVGNEITRKQAAGILNGRRQIGAPALHGNPPLRRTTNVGNKHPYKARKISDSTGSSHQKQEDQ